MRFAWPAPVIASLLISILLPSKALTNAADACAAIGAAFQAGKVVPIKSALACMYSIPYNSDRSAATVDTLYKTFDLHTYKDISIKSPTPEFDVNIDVLESLLIINRTVYHNDFEFNHAVFSVINALNDGHAVYFTCYVQTLESYTAFPLVKILNAAGTSEVVKISSLAGMLEPKIVNATEKHLKIKVVDYAGATLLKINNKDPIAFIERYVKTGGYSKDFNARINEAYSRVLADGTILYGSMMGSPILTAPKVPFIKYRLIRAGSTTPETIYAPYFVDLRAGENFTSASDFFAKNCLPLPPVPASSAASVAVVSKSRLVWGMSAKPGVMSSRVPIPPNLPSHLQHFNALKGGRRRHRIKKLGAHTDFIKAFILGDQKTGVLYIPNMKGPNGNASKWFTDLHNGIFEIKAAGGTRLILDLQENPGGYIYFAYALLEYLFPSITNPQYPIQNPDTPLVTKMVQANDEVLKTMSSPSQYRWSIYGTNSSTPFTSSDGFFFPSVPLTYNGKTSQFSSLRYYIDGLGRDDVTPHFEVNQTIILSNGRCYSTCSIFSYLMQEYGVKIISAGGSLGKPMAYSAGTCGQSYDLHTLLTNDLQFLNLTGAEGAPKPLPVRGFVGYTTSQAFIPQSKTIPGDFVFKPADYRFAFTAASVESVEALYEQATKYFV